MFLGKSGCILLRAGGYFTVFPTIQDNIHTHTHTHTGDAEVVSIDAFVKEPRGVTVGVTLIKARVTAHIL